MQTSCLLAKHPALTKIDRDCLLWVRLDNC